VHATIALAKLVKTKQPRLFDYLFKLRNKHEVFKILNVAEQKPVLHCSAMFSSERFCTTLVMPLAMHPSNKNAVISYDLSVDPTPLISLTVAEIQQRLYTPKADLAEGVARIPLKTIQANRCPVLATTQLLDETVATRIQLDVAQARLHYKQLKQAKDLPKKLAEVFAQQEFPARTDPDVMLYSGGFASQNDKETMSQVRSSSAEQLTENSFFFEDDRFTEMLFRYRARNYPQTLNEDEQLQWQGFCYQRLTEVDGGGSIVMDDYLQQVHKLLEQPSISERDRKILEQLLDYSDSVLV
jgi:exodeoxyribonuclease-1